MNTKTHECQYIFYSKKNEMKDGFGWTIENRSMPAVPFRFDTAANAKQFCRDQGLRFYALDAEDADRAVAERHYAETMNGRLLTLMLDNKGSDKGLYLAIGWGIFMFGWVAVCMVRGVV